MRREKTEMRKKRDDDGILIWNYQFGWSRNAVIYDAKTVKLKSLTQHFISADIDACYAERWVGICTVFINREFPIMNSSWETDGAKGDTMFPAISRYRSVVVHKV